MAQGPQPPCPFRADAICPPVSAEASGRKGSEEQGGRAPGKRVRGKCASPQPAADLAWHHCCGPRAPTWRARWGQQEQVQLQGKETPAAPPWTQPSLATLLLNTGRNLVPSAWLSFSSLPALSSLSPPCMLPLSPGEVTPLVPTLSSTALDKSPGSTQLLLAFS